MTSCNVTSWRILRFEVTCTLPLMTIAFHVLFMKGSCNYSSVKQSYTIVESRAISHLDDTEQQAQQVAEILHFQPRLLWRTPTKIHQERRRRRQQKAARKAQRTSLSTATATSSTQRPQTCPEAATKYYNYIANGADEEREHRPPTLQRAMGRTGNAYSYSKIICFDAMIGSNSYTICSMHVKNIFPTD